MGLNPLPANIRKGVLHEITRDGITSFHGIHGQLPIIYIQD